MKTEKKTWLGVAIGVTVLFVTAYFGARVISAGWEAGQKSS